MKNIFKLTSIILFLIVSIIFICLYCHEGEPSYDIQKIMHPSDVRIGIISPVEIISSSNTAPNMLQQFSVSGTAISISQERATTLKIATVKIKVDSEKYIDNAECTLNGPDSSGIYTWQTLVEPQKYCKRQDLHQITAKAWDEVDSESESFNNGHFLVAPTQSIQIQKIAGSDIYNDIVVNSINIISITGNSIINYPRSYDMASTNSVITLWIDSTNQVFYADGSSEWYISIDPLDYPGTHELCAMYKDNCGDEYKSCYTIKMGFGSCDLKVGFVTPTRDAPNLCDITSTQDMEPALFSGPIPSGAITGTAFAGSNCSLNTVQIQIDSRAWMECETTNIGVTGAIVSFANKNPIHTCYYQSYVASTSVYPADTCSSSTFFSSGNVPLFGYSHVIKVRGVGIEEGTVNYFWNFGSRLVYFKNQLNVDIITPTANQTVTSSYIDITATASGTYFLNDPSLFSYPCLGGTNSYNWKVCWNTSDPYSIDKCTSFVPYSSSSVNKVDIFYSLNTISASIGMGSHVLFVYATDYCGTDNWLAGKYVVIQK